MIPYEWNVSFFTICYCHILFCMKSCFFFFFKKILTFLLVSKMAFKYSFSQAPSYSFENFFDWCFTKYSRIFSFYDGRPCIIMIRENRTLGSPWESAGFWQIFPRTIKKKAASDSGNRRLKNKEGETHSKTHHFHMWQWSSHIYPSLYGQEEVF